MAISVDRQRRAAPSVHACERVDGAPGIGISSGVQDRA